MDKLLLIDGNSIVNRAFYAMPNLTSSKGICTGGIFGFLKMLSKVIKEEQPTHVGVAFDLKAPTFRHLQYAEYKAGRHPMPEELAQQIPILKEILKSMNVATFELAGYEADDILGTLSKNFDGESIIVSGDKDILQLVANNCTVFHTKKGITDVIKYTPELLASEGIAKPIYITDLKGLMGDSSDNLKGVQGVGKVTASNLIAQYGNLENLYEHIDEIKGKLKEKLLDGKQDAFQTRDLATIYREVPIDSSKENLAYNYVLPFEAYRAMVDLDFKNVDEMFAFENAVKTDEFKVEYLQSIEELQQALKGSLSTGKLSFNIDDGFSFTCDGVLEYKIKEQQTLLDVSIDFDTACEVLCDFISKNKVKITVFDLKYVYRMLKNYIQPFEADDLLLLSYVADISKHKTNINDLLESYSKNCEYPCCSILELFNELQVLTKKDNSYNVYKDIELPLVRVLFDMEERGFRVDTNVLDCLNQEYSAKIEQLQKQIYDYAGVAFNINSPKQLGEVLFDKLGLPGGKKKSTSVDVLEKLALVHPIVPLIMEYRKMSKLLSTYIVAMPKLLDNESTLHTVFKQALTTTGRLSSTEPNLQNIPVRTKDGKEIRKAFVAAKGNKLVVADYSQIELRLMAHMSGDEHMIADFLSNKDIHTATAAKVFGVSPENVDHEMRRSAKAVNFGIIYGISDFGLSEGIGCSIQMAREFIKKYFEGYPKVKEYMDTTVANAKKLGYVETLLGRKRIIPELKSPVYTIRTFGERAAMNMPLQGTASDIIKAAMIQVYEKLKAVDGAKLILQVHDELIIDCPNESVDIVADIVKSTMESVCQLSVPLIAEVGVGDNWLEAKD